MNLILKGAAELQFRSIVVNQEGNDTSMALPIMILAEMPLQGMIKGAPQFCPSLTLLSPKRNALPKKIPKKIYLSTKMGSF